MPSLIGLFVLAPLAATAGPPAATAPFDVASGRPMIQLKVDGKGPYPFVLDTGAPGLLIMRSLADELGLEVLGPAQLESPVRGKPVDTQRVRVDSIALGGAEVRDLEATVLDMDGLGLGKGVVGPFVFHERGAVTLDFEHNTIALGEAAPPDVKTWIPLGESAPLLDVPLRIGELVVDGHIDTGSPGVLAVPAKLEDRLPLAGPVRVVGKARTLDAELELRGAPIDGPVRAGDAEIPLRQIELAELPKANLGTAGLRGLVLHVDWEKRRFALKGTADTAPGGPRRVVRVAPGGDGPRFGIRGIPLPGGAIQVAGTDPGSPAESIGLLAGDKIVAVNGKPTSEMEPAQLHAELAGADLKLTIDRGGETLTLSRPR